MLFEDLKLIEPIMEALKKEGYTHPTPIQQQAIPPALEGRDILGCAQTGTGKTAAFTIPILQILDAQKSERQNPKRIKALVLTPTRELAIQIGESVAAYGANLGLSHVVVFGGVSQHQQVNTVRAGVDILIATPGRLMDLVQQRHINLDHISLFVLDEADRMLDMGFITDVKKIINKLPEKKQTFFFSATMPKEILHLVHSILNNPVRVEVTPVSSTAEHVEQSVYFVEKADKPALLVHVLQDENIKSALVFTRTKYGADKVVRFLRRANIHADAIHGEKSQNARQRALSMFKSGQLRVLIATDIASRGIDVDDLSHVINYELPNIPETYVHRIGRTGRAGATGIALSFCDAEERIFLKDIQKLIAKTVPPVPEHPHQSMLGVMTVSAPDSGKSSGGFRSSGGGGGRRNKTWMQAASPKR